MTENTTLPEAKRDGKAQAAADKAYRKASRPWFKKKRFILPLALVLIMIISSIANGGKKDNSSATVAPAADASAAAPGAAPAPAATEAPAKAAAPEVVSVDAAQLLADFKGNEAAADAKYKGKVLQVTGSVDKVDTELLDKDQYIVRLDNGDQFSFLHVNCSDIAAAKAATIVPESAITVRGTFQDGGDLGVELKACEVL
ncbi:OB-fold putative lipoprotein [Pseudarthrobacter sp. SSS035]|uniref:OB-fold putative lipoprotein n=1 Tax=Pseudarthrobacter sp. SSS035 TaxID=2931399 RepID=UPI00200D044B|nr:OB-fold putative lipoprotein [Pseudarthrobacter sp. SSS035]